MWQTPASTDSRSSSGSSRPASHRRPLTPNRSEHGGLPCRRRCSTGVDLVLCPRTCVHQLLAPGQPAPQHAAALIRHPHRLKLARPQQPRQRARVHRSVFARACVMPVSSGLTRQRHPHLPRRSGHRTGEPAGQRRRPIRALSTIQASRTDGRTKSTGSKPIAQTGLPACVLPTKPCPGSPDPTAGPRQSLQGAFSCRETRRRSRSRLVPRDARYAIDRSIERGDRAYAGRLRLCNQIRLGEVHAFELVDLERP